MMNRTIIACTVCGLLCLSVQAQQTDYQQLVRQGIEALAADSLQSAEAFFRRALAEAPAASGNALLWGHLAAIAERQGREHEALDDYNVGIGLLTKKPDQRSTSQTQRQQADRGAVGLLLGRASLYMKLERAERALVDYNDVVDLHPDHPEALLMRAYIRQQQRLYKEARKDYEHLLHLHPTHEQALLGLALLNDDDRRPREAMELLNRAVALYPSHAAGYALRAGMELERGQYELAEADYSEAIRLSPNDPTYLLARAQLYVQTKRKKLAREDARRAAALGASGAEVAGALDVQR